MKLSEVLSRRKQPLRPTTALAILMIGALAGAPQAHAGPEDPEDGGQWGPIIPWPHVPVSAANLPDGRILTWSGSERDTWPSSEQTYTATWDPQTNAFNEIFHLDHNMFCSHLAMLADGRVFVNGGRNQTLSKWTSVFDYRDNSWTQMEDMGEGGRWYPTTLTLPNGDVLTAIGTATQPRYPEIWTPDTPQDPGGSWQTKNGIDFNDMVLDDYTSSHRESNWWPLLHVAPNGQIFHSGPTPKMHYIDVQGNGSYQQVGPQFNSWYHKHGTTVMYDEGKLLTAGGWTAGRTSASTNRAFTIDLNGPSPVLTEIDSMTHARKFHNGVILPNGEVLVIGGNTSGAKFSDAGTILASEIWNPVTEQWRLAASSGKPRNYHSIALLLVDGRVLSGGSGYCTFNPTCDGATHQDGQVYSPPYLFDSNGNPAPRPSINSGPGFISSGQQFNVQATAGLQKFSMIKMSSTTHGLNTDVRFLNVSFTENSPGNYTLTAHNNINVLTAGYWMLFGLNSNGVPSVAHVVQANANGSPWIADPGDQSTPVNGSVSLQIVAGDGDDDTLTYTATGLPPGLSINAVSGLISGTPTLVGNYTTTVTVDDFDEGTADTTFQWSVYDPGGGCSDCIDFNVTTTIRYSSQDKDADFQVLDGGATLELSNNTWRRTVAEFAVTPNTVIEFDFWSDSESEFQGLGFDENNSFFDDPRFFRLWGTQAFNGSILDFDDYSSPGTVQHFRIPVGEFYTGAAMRLAFINDDDAGTGTTIRFTNVRVFEDGSGSGELATLNDPTPSESGSDATLSITPNRAGLQFNWNPGDGSGDSGFGSNSSFDHTYSAPGLYVVSVTVRDPSTSEETTYTFTQLIHSPLTSGSPTRSASLAVHGGQQQVWNVNPDNDSVTVINANTNNFIAEISVGDQPESVGVAPDGTVWVVNKGSANISVINSSSLAVIDTISLDFASRPHGLAFRPSASHAFVALEATGDLLKINTNTRNEVNRRYIGPNIRHVSVSADGSRVYVSRFVTPPLPNEATSAPIVESGGQYYGGEVAVVDGGNLNIYSTVVLRHSDRLVSEHTGPGVPNYLGPAVISPDGLSAWVPSKQDNILAGGLRGGQGMTFDQTVRAVTSKINLVSQAEDFPSRVDHDNASIASNAAFGPYGVYLFTSLEGNREVAVSNAYTGFEIHRFDVGRAPHGLSVSNDGSKLFVHNFLDRSVGVYDISDITQRNELNVTPITSVDTVGNESLSSTILLGKQLFYDARDPRLAADSYMSCASCHNDGGADGRIWDFTGVGEGLRNTITLEGRGGTAHGFLHWSANFDEVQDFEAQIRDFAGGSGLMDDSDFFSGTRSQPLGQTKAGFSGDLDALAAYVTSLNQIPDSPYRNADGTMTAAAQAGQAVFDANNCASCHTAPRFTDSGAVVLHDVGTIKPSSGQRLGGPLTGLDTPSLLGVWQTAPYLHDGSAFDVSEAVEAHSGISLTAQQISDVSAYLMELDSANSGGCSDCLDFNLLPTSSFSNQDAAGTIAIQDGGNAVELTNNTWRRTNQRFTITADTVLEFDFQSNAEAEYQGIGFDNNNVAFDAQRFFRMWGTQSISQATLGYFDYTGGGAPQHYSIPVGQYYQGSMYLVLINDYDAGSGTNSRFSNVRIVTGGSGNQPPVISNPGPQSTIHNAGVDMTIAATDPDPGDTLTFSATGLPTGLSIISSTGRIGGTATTIGEYNVTVTVDDGNGGTDSESFTWSVIPRSSACTDCLDFNVVTTISYSNAQDKDGTFQVLNGGLAIELTNNTWRRSTQFFTITPNTVIEFDFSSTEQAEFQGLGFDENNTHYDAPRFFRVWGNQGIAQAIDDYDNYTGSGTQHFVIPVGQYYTGSQMRLVLINDFDFGPGTDSRFSNVRIYESGN